MVMIDERQSSIAARAKLPHFGGDLRHILVVLAKR